jgi:ribosome maturation factor RimP
MHDILDNIRSQIGPIIKDTDTELFGISLKQTPDGTVLSLLVDTQKGITIDECAAINKQVSRVLEEKDIIKGRYIVEVASPGVDRPLRFQSDFKKVIGTPVGIWLLDKKQGSIFINGIVKRADKDSIEVEEKNGNCVVLTYDMVNKAKRSF